MPRLIQIQQSILDALRANPDGLDITEIRAKIDAPGIQQHLDRRVRSLDPYFVIERIRVDGRTVYKLIGPRPDGTLDDVPINKTLRAKILHDYGERCQMCGRTVAEDHVKLHIDHKIPRDWGGKTVAENLWPLCSTCNEGKKNYFATFDAALMKDLLRNKSPHMRMAVLLTTKSSEWIDSDLLQFVANFNDFQEDWQRRLRELKELGLEYENEKRRVGRRVKSFYRVKKGATIPAGISEKQKRMRKR